MLDALIVVVQQPRYRERAPTSASPSGNDFFGCSVKATNDRRGS